MGDHILKFLLSTRKNTDVQDSQTVRIPQGCTVVDSLQNVPTFTVSIEPHKSPVIRAGMNSKSLGDLPGITQWVGMQQEPEPEPEAEPDFMTTSLSSSVPGNHDVQTLRL